MTKTSAKKSKPLFPYDRAREHLVNNGWRRLSADGQTELWGKNGRVLILAAQRDLGFEVFYPTPTMFTDACLAEMEQYAKDGTLPRREHE